jgi:hypothetical protein
MDSFVIINAVMAFFLFFILHIMVFRFINASKVLKGLVYVFIAAGFIDFIFGWALNLIWYHLSVTNLIISLVLDVLLYFNLTLFSILAFFGISVTSLRIHILSLIGRSREGGLSYGQILEEYNKDIIIKTRLTRLIGSGVLRKAEGKYESGSRYSYFMFHTFLLIFMRRLYQRTSIDRSQ